MRDEGLIPIYQKSKTSASQPVVPGRFELPTSTLSVWRSNQLSYRTVEGRPSRRVPPYIEKDRRRHKKSEVRASVSKDA